MNVLFMWTYMTNGAYLATYFPEKGVGLCVSFLLILFLLSLQLKDWKILYFLLHYFFFLSIAFILFYFIFLNLWLCWVFVSVRGLSPFAASGGHSSSQCAGLLLSRPLLLRSTGSRRVDSAIVAHGPSRSAACGIFPDQGSNPLLHYFYLYLSFSLLGRLILGVLNTGHLFWAFRMTVMVGLRGVALCCSAPIFTWMIGECGPSISAPKYYQGALGNIPQPLGINLPCKTLLS